MNKLIPLVLLAASACPVAAHPGAGPNAAVHAVLHAFDGPIWIAAAVLAGVALAARLLRRVPQRSADTARPPRKR